VQPKEHFGVNQSIPIRGLHAYEATSQRLRGHWFLITKVRAVRQRDMGGALASFEPGALFAFDSRQVKQGARAEQPMLSNRPEVRFFSKVKDVGRKIQITSPACWFVGISSNNP
jgi:hypothetical protein